MKRFICGCLSLLLLSLVVSGCTASKDSKKTDTDGTETVQISTKQEETVTSYVQNLASSNITALKEDYVYDTKMKEVVETENFDQQMLQMMQTLGTLKETKQAYAVRYQGTTSAFLPCIFENQSANVMLAFNDADEIIGVFLKPYQEQDTTIMPDDVNEVALNVPVNDTVSNSGILTTPSDVKHPPVVILIAGSGPCDMDESLFSNKPFRDIAWGLAQQGVASYRFDKRTYKNAATLPDDLTVQDEYVDDVLAAIDLIKQQKNLDTNNIYLLGHSEGGYVLPRIASQTKDVSGYVMMAAPARPLEDLFVEQIAYLANLDGSISEEEQLSIDESTKEQQAVKDIQADSAQRMYFGMLPTSYLYDLKDYNPLTVAASIQEPVYVAQGDRDYQVTMDDYTAWNEAYRDSKNWSFKTYEGLNHVMMEGSNPPSPKNYETRSNVSATFITDIAEFIKR